MKNTILHPNATPVYSFFSFINTKLEKGELKKPLKILDCGAGGAVPPLALFAEYGFETYGIDISEEQLGKAKQYCFENNLEVDFQKADMRKIPFENESFDCVFEHYSMCHLSSIDTQKTINEMIRVTKFDGYVMFGVISRDCWPLSIYGKEEERGSFWTHELDGTSYMHCMFTDEEADYLVHDFRVISKEKHKTYRRDYAAKLTKEDWQNLRDDYHGVCTPKEWKDLFEKRFSLCNYSHIHFILKKVK